MLISECCKKIVDFVDGTFAYYRCSHCHRPSVTILATDDQQKEKTMPAFSAESLSKLQTCHLDLQALFFEVIRTYNCTIIQGHRGEQEQDADFVAGKTQLKYPFGNHNAMPSNAVDVMPDPIDYNDTKAIIFFAGYVLGMAQKLKDEGKITHSIRWGGNWKMDHDLKDNGFCDLSHFELHV